MMTTAANKGGRLATKEQSRINVTPSNSDDFNNAFVVLSQLLTSCYGPRGSCKAIHNNSGGHVLVTSHGTRMLQCLHFSRPVLRLWASALQGHVGEFMDQSLFAGRLSLNLIQGAMELKCHRHLVMDIFSLLSSVCVDYLDTDQCNVKFGFSSSPADKVRQLRLLVKCVIDSKPLCGLDEMDLDHIAKLSLETHLSTNSSARESNHIHYVQLEGYDPKDSCLIEGILYQTPHIPVYAAQSVKNIPRVADGPFQGRIRSILLCISLAGDLEEFPEVTYEMSQRFSFEQAAVDKMMVLGQRLVDDQVGVLLCQKVVHPELRQLLESRHVLVLDRLGSVHAQLMPALTGGASVKSFTSNTSLMESYGYLDDVQHCVYAERSYVQMTSQENAVKTVVIANRSEESLAELKAVFESSQRVLHLSEHVPMYLAGGGCWQSVLAAYVQQQAKDKLHDWAKRVEAPVIHIQQIISCFTTSLLKAAFPLAEPGHYDVIDTSHLHHWSLPTCVQANHLRCSCGLIPHRDGIKFNEVLNCKDLLGTHSGQRLSSQYMDECSVIDCFAAARNALQCGIAMANMVIGIANTVQNTN